MPEINAILEASREKEKRDRIFLASLQGIDLQNNEEEVTFEDIKARVFSGGTAENAKDIMSLQGINAKQKGFGIGMGIDYKIADENFSWSSL